MKRKIGGIIFVGVVAMAIMTGCTEMSGDVEAGTKVDFITVMDLKFPTNKQYGNDDDITIVEHVDTGCQYFILESYVGHGKHSKSIAPYIVDGKPYCKGES